MYSPFFSLPSISTAFYGPQETTSSYAMSGAVQYNTVQKSAVQHTAVQCCTVQYSTVLMAEGLGLGTNIPQVTIWQDFLLLFIFCHRYSTWTSVVWIMLEPKWKLTTRVFATSYPYDCTVSYPCKYTWHWNHFDQRYYSMICSWLDNLDFTNYLHLLYFSEIKSAPWDFFVN